MSEPVDLTGMTPEQVRRAVRAAAKTMEPQRPARPKTRRSPKAMGLKSKVPSPPKA